MDMTKIERTVQVSFRHQVFFTRNVFLPTNPLLRDVLVNEEDKDLHKALVVLDDSLALAQPTLTRSIECYFNAFPDSLKLVCPPIVAEGGERVKNSYFHVSEIQPPIDRYHIDRP
ncbi:MAG: 3-dehydroquinate synthase, partial [Pedosphaera parvula]|nr:3-dehydroquinate synthase [Pedosphaera parvula]